MKTTNENPLLIRDELDQLARNHYREIYGESLTYDPAWQTLAAAWEAGTLTCVTARDDSGASCAYGKLVGYELAWLKRDPHSMDRIIAYLDSLYVMPERRNEGIAKQLIMTSEIIFRDRGVTRVFGALPKHYDGIKLMSNQRYLPFETVYMKDL